MCQEFGLANTFMSQDESFMNSVHSSRRQTDQGFPYWGDDGSPPTPLAKNLLNPSLPGNPTSRLPPINFLFPPTKSQFSCYNPIKPSFLAVVIVPLPSLL